MKDNMTIEELAEYVNGQIAQEASATVDGRYASQISVRRIRDYLSKGLLDKPMKNGRQIYFDETHAQKLLALRKMQSQGLSDQYLKKVVSVPDFAEQLTSTSQGSSISDEDLQKNAMTALKGLIVEPAASLSAMHYQSNVASLVAQSALGSASQLLSSKTVELKKKMLTYEPHPRVTLQVEEGSTFSEAEIQQISNDIQSILRRQK